MIPATICSLCCMSYVRYLVPETTKKKDRIVSITGTMYQVRSKARKKKDDRTQGPSTSRLAVFFVAHGRTADCFSFIARRWHVHFWDHASTCLTFTPYEHLLGGSPLESVPLLRQHPRFRDNENSTVYTETKGSLSAIIYDLRDTARVYLHRNDSGNESRAGVTMLTSKRQPCRKRIEIAQIIKAVPGTKHVFGVHDDFLYLFLRYTLRVISTRCTLHHKYEHCDQVLLLLLLLRKCRGYYAYIETTAAAKKDRNCSNRNKSIKMQELVLSMYLALVTIFCTCFPGTLYE